MDDNYREFNPLHATLVVDREVEDDIENLQPVNVSQPTWPEISSELQMELLKKQRLDGLIVAADTMQIAKNCGVLQFLQYPTVVDRHLNRFKGLRDFFGADTKHLYEFSLCSLGGGITLSAVIATNQVVKHGERPTYPKMVQEYHNCVRRSISKLPMSRMTAIFNRLAPNAPIQIYKEDWTDVCGNLYDELQETARNMSKENVFPKKPSFFWVAKVLGQNLEYDEAERKETLGAYKFAVNLNVSQRFAVAIHCAIDVELKDNMLFWNPIAVAKNHKNLKPAVLFHVGLLPGLANLTYANVERDKFSYVQYYSRVFAGCHRDSYNIFMYNGVAKSLYNRYCRKMGNMKKVKPSLRDMFIDDIDGKLATLFNGLRECCSLTTPARYEAVWTMPSNFSGFNDITDIIVAAFKDLDVDCRESHPMFHPTMLVNMPTSDFASRLVPWINVFESTIRSLSESVQLLEKEETLWSIDASLVIPRERFLCVQVAELLMHLIIKGRPHKSYPSCLDDYLGISNEFLADYQNYGLLCGDWPFQNTLVDENNRLVAEHPEELQEKLSVMTGLELEGNRFLLFAEKRRQFCALPDPYRDSRNFREIFKQLASDLMDLILYIQKSKTSTSNWGEITLKMIFLEKIDYSRKIRHLSAEDFVKLLAYPEGSRMPCFEETRKLTKILDQLKSDTNRFSGFRTVLKNKIEEMIGQENYPLRFSFGRMHDIYVYNSLESYPPPENSLVALDKGLIETNKRRSTNCTVPLKDIVQACKDFLQANNFGNLAEVAASIQDIFDAQKIKTIRKVPKDLKTTLLNLLGNLSAEDEGSEDDQSFSDENEMEYTDADAARNLEAAPIAHSAPRPGTSVVKKTRAPSLTRSDNVRKGMLKMHAAKRARHPDD